MRLLLPYAGLAAASVALDQWIKALVEARLVLEESVPLLPFLALYRTYNTGIAFSMFSSFGDGALIVLALAVIGFVLYLAAGTRPDQLLARSGFAFVVGGAVGNLIDRVHNRMGVIDFLDMGFGNVRWPVFNVADIAVTVGAMLLALSLWREEREIEARQKAEAARAAAPLETE